MRKTLLCFLIGAATLSVAAAQQSKKQDPTKRARDLKYELEDVDQPAAGKVSIPRSYAVVIGVSDYPKLSKTMQLKYTERDAEAVYSILISREGGNFPAENVRKLTGSKATLANIREALEVWLPSVTKEDDRVMVYYAGHGFVYQGKVYLAPSDFDGSNPSGSGYSSEALGSAFGSRIKGKWKVLLTDACHSGAVSSETDARTLNSRLLDLNRSLFSLTASRDREQSFESEAWGGGHGIFTYYVVKGIEGEADESKDGVVSADELAAYVGRNVREASRGKQNPTVGGSFDNNMLLAYNPAGATLGTRPQPKEGTLIVETNMDGVEIFIDGKSQGVVNKGQQHRVPGLTPGLHQVKAVRMGYEPVGPREEMVYPGQDTTVTIKVLIPRKRPKAALDKFDDAVEEYLKSKGPADYRRAVASFQEVLRLDGTYSEAVLYLGRAYRDLGETDEAAKLFKRALELDPDYTEARATYGALLFDVGDIDEAIRMLNAVVQRDRNHAMSHYLLAQAFRIKEAYDQGIDAAKNAIRLTPNNGEAHFWYAECLRMKGRYAEALTEYVQYLKLTNYESSTAFKIVHHSIGIGKFLGKKRAGTTDVWKEVRKLAYFGMCDSERKLGNFDQAIALCQKSLSFDREDPQTHYVLGLSYSREYEKSSDLSLLPAARKHYARMLEINGDLAEADYAKKNIKAIDEYLRQQ